MNRKDSYPFSLINEFSQKSIQPSSIKLFNNRNYRGNFCPVNFSNPMKDSKKQNYSFPRILAQEVPIHFNFLSHET